MTVGRGSSSRRPTNTPSSCSPSNSRESALLAHSASLASSASFATLFMFRAVPDAPPGCELRPALAARIVRRRSRAGPAPSPHRRRSARHRARPSPAPRRGRSRRPRCRLVGERIGLRRLRHLAAVRIITPTGFAHVRRRSRASSSRFGEAVSPCRWRTADCRSAMNVRRMCQARARRRSRLSSPSSACARRHSPPEQRDVCSVMLPPIAAPPARGLRR